jgi:phosphatidylglycerol lysyltransferase
MKEFFRKWVPRILPVLFFLAAIYVLFRELRPYTLETLTDQLDVFTGTQVTLAAAITLLCYLALTAYDALALHYIGHRLSFVRLLLSSFLGYAFSNNLGWPIITGTSMRYRFYSRWKITAFQAAKVVAFTNVTAWTGICFLGSIIFFYEPISLSGIGFLEGYTTLPLGFISLGFTLLFITFVIFRREPVPLARWSIPIPSLRMAVGQIAASSLDWILAAWVFYILLPLGHPMDFIQILQIFILAQIVALISHVPGGLGIFEALVVRFLAEDISKPEIMGSLLVFRICYYMMPLLLGLLILGFYEIFGQHPKVPRQPSASHTKMKLKNS